MSIAANRLLNTMTKIGNERAELTKTELFYGTVTSSAPLQITYMAEESKAITLPENMLLLPTTCKAKAITVAGETVQLWGDLVVGDKVILISGNAGQRYMVERV